MKKLTASQLAKMERMGVKVHRNPVAPDKTAMLAEQAIASMRDAINHNEAVMGEVIARLTSRPVRFDISRDNKGNMTSITPIYDKM